MFAHQETKMYHKGSVLVLVFVCFAALDSNPVWGRCESQKLLASEGDQFDKFGWSLAINEDTLCIGASSHAGLINPSAGSVYLYRHNGLRWVQESILQATDGMTGDGFGLSVAVWDKEVIVGAVGVDGEPPIQDLGAAYIFRFDTDAQTWIEEAKLSAPDGIHMDKFARSVGISGNFAVAGAHGDDDNGQSSGSAYVFTYDGLKWSTPIKLLPSDGAEGDRFGAAVAISGDMILIGTPENADAGLFTGSAYIFRYDSESSLWVEEAKLLASDAAIADWFGRSVAIHGNDVIIGAPQFYAARPGAAYIFHYDGSKWIEQAKLMATDGDEEDHFGESVQIADGIAIVGAREHDDLGEDSGSAYVFRYDPKTSTWREQTKLLASDGEPGEWFGHSVAIQESTAVVGAIFDNENGPESGSAYVFDVALNCDCPQDLDADGNVGASDLLALLVAWGPNPDHPADFDGDGNVGASDLIALLANWGPCP